MSGLSISVSRAVRKAHPDCAEEYSSPSLPQCVCRLLSRQIGHLRRQHHRLRHCIVVVRRKSTVSLSISARNSLARRDIRTSVAYCRRCVAVNRTKVALSVFQRITHRRPCAILDQRIVNRTVPAVVFTVNVTNYARTSSAACCTSSQAHAAQTNAAVMASGRHAWIRNGPPNNNTERIFTYDLRISRFHSSIGCCDMLGSL